MKILLNGEEKCISDNSNLIDIVSEMQNILPKFFVIELNGNVVYKEEYKTTVLKDNDSLEVVVFAGGG